SAWAADGRGRGRSEVGGYGVQEVVGPVGRRLEGQRSTSPDTNLKSSSLQTQDSGPRFHTRINHQKPRRIRAPELSLESTSQSQCLQVSSRAARTQIATRPSPRRLYHHV